MTDDVDYGPYKGLPFEEYAKRVHAFEGNGCTGSNCGPFQMGPSEASRYGGYGVQALANEYAHHHTLLSNALGRTPENWESYFTHQQGPGGGPALLKAYYGGNGELPASQVLRPMYKNSFIAQKAITGNTYDDAPFDKKTATVSQFVDYWRNKWLNHEQTGSRNYSANLSGVPSAPAGAPVAGAALAASVPGAAVPVASEPSASGAQQSPVNDPANTPNPQLNSAIAGMMQPEENADNSGKIDFLPTQTPGALAIRAQFDPRAQLMRKLQQWTAPQQQIGAS